MKEKVRSRESFLKMRKITACFLADGNDPVEKEMSVP